jgi:uroporphyrinogen decarboxylase
MFTHLTHNILHSPQRLVIPIGVYGGLKIIGGNVRQAISDAAVQSEAALALQEHLQTSALLTCMDLSVEAECFGCQIRVADDDVPTVIGRRAESLAEIEALPTPEVGAGRTDVYLETTRTLVAAGKDRRVPALPGVIGPFSLAGRIFGVSEALESSAADPDLLQTLLDKVTPFLIDYILAFRQLGAAGVIMAEPAAGLLSPRGLGRFSAPYVRQIVEATQTPDFTLILHNCGAKLPHLPKVLASGAEIYHFGAPMDLPAALAEVQGQAVLAGNLDPADVFLNGTPDSIHHKTAALLEATRPYAHYFLSSGCDLPPGTPLENIRAFVETARSAN